MNIVMPLSDHKLGDWCRAVGNDNSETKGVRQVENTFDSTYIIRKDKYHEFVNDAERLAIAAYIIPAFVWREL